MDAGTLRLLSSLRLFAVIIGLAAPYYYGRSQALSQLGTTTWLQVSNIPLRGYRYQQGPIVNDNTPEQIGKEVLNGDFLKLVGKSAGISDRELSDLKTSLVDSHTLTIRDEGTSQSTFKLLSSYASWYVAARASGHSVGFCYGGITNKQRVPRDPSVRALVQNEPLLPVAGLRKLMQDSYTNKAGTDAGWTSSVIFTNGEFQEHTTTNIRKTDEVVRSVRYLLVDGDIAWVYQIDTSPRDPFPAFVAMRHDAKDYDPKYRQVLEEITQKATDDMRSEGKPASVFRIEFVRRKKQLLKAAGIDWWTPEELNPPDRKSLMVY